MVTNWFRPGSGTGGRVTRLGEMQLSVPQRAVKIRILAAEMRDHAAHTKQPDYQDKFERTASELEDLAERLELRDGASTSSKSN